MYITVEELKSVLYEYQVREITEDDGTIAEEAIMAAEEEVKGYLVASNNRRETATLTAQQYAAWKLYDVDAIFAKTGAERNSFLVRIVQRIAAWNLCELASPDIIYERVKERHDAAISTLEKIAGMGEYAGSRLVIGALDSPELSPDEAETKPFRMVSRRKFRHE